ncbi:RNA polymerase sigma factor [bacterium SCSIO 12696]|nr:RNA polymerase sigma factor [bacterium SCSIO 12696]
MDWLSIFNENRTELLHYLQGRLKSDADAQDVLQEIYLRTSRLKAKDVNNPKAYIYKIANNLAIDYQRSNSSYSRLKQNLEQSHTDADTATEPAPDRAYEAQQRLSVLKEAIDSLPTKCRRAFILHRFGRKKVAEIAKELGVGKNSVEKYIIRAMRECSAAIDRYEAASRRVDDK